jgi:YjbE family integral membrane protein
MGLAAGLRIFFAAIASYLLAIPGILFIGGCLLAFVCYRFFKELRHHNAKSSNDKIAKIEVSGSERSQLLKALTTITIADVSMSIDNVVAVAAIARENTSLLIFGLVVAIAFMAFFATMIMRLMTRYSWLSWLGLLFLVYLTYKMLHDGLPEIILLLT